MSAIRSTILSNKLAELGPAAQTILLSAILALALALAEVVALGISGSQGAIAAAVAALVCWIGAIVALGAAAIFHGPAGAMPRMLVGMLGRTLFPLVLGVTLHFKVPALAEGGMVFYLLVFYFLAMATETVLLVAQVSSTRAGAPRA